MGKTFADLRSSVAAALGFAYADLEAQDQADVDTIVNGAYLDCFAAKDGRRPTWASMYWADVIPAPTAVTLGLTTGSVDVTGYTFLAKYAASFVQIGDAYYRIATATTLVEPWAGATGSVSATVYANAIALPGIVVRVREMPNLLGIGPLTPMPFPEDEILLRSSPVYDFNSLTGRAPFIFARPRFQPGVFTDVGDPRYYHIDSAYAGPTFSTGSRIHLFPLPGSTMTIELRVDILPAPLRQPTDEPILPHDDVDVAGAIMEPFMFARLLKHPLGRRYSGSNGQLILQQAADAQAQLNTFRSVQLSGPKQITRASMW